MIGPVLVLILSLLSPIPFPPTDGTAGDQSGPPRGAAGETLATSLRAGIDLSGLIQPVPDYRRRGGRKAQASDHANASVPRSAIGRALIGGKATWYPARGYIAAAGPALRDYLGPHWRGTLASVCSGGRCVVLRILDWCQCGGRGHPRLIDLSDDAFRELAPLSKGIIPVEITRAVRVPEPPATDTDD